MKRARGSALAPASCEALARVRRTLREQAASPAVAQPSPEKPRPAENGAALFRRAVAGAVPLKGTPLLRPVARVRGKLDWRKHGQVWMAQEKTRLSLAALKRIPSGVWALGFVSLFMDVSSEMIHA